MRATYPIHLILFLFDCPNNIWWRIQLRLILKMNAFWVVAPRRFVEIDRRFRGTYCLNQQGHHSSSWWWQLGWLVIICCWKDFGPYGIFMTVCLLLWSQGSSVSIVSECGLDDQGSIPDRGRGFFLQPLPPDRLWGPPNLLYNGYRGSFPRG
jgi:hypothetical protein